LGGAQLRDADLRHAGLQAADLGGAEFEGGNLWGAELQRAFLLDAQLQGADLRRAELQGADLQTAKLQGMDLRFAQLYSAIVEKGRTAVLDMRSARWTPLDEGRRVEIRAMLVATSTNARRRKEALARIERAGSAAVPPPLLESCLIDPEVAPGLKCQRQWLPAEVEAFRSELFPVLEGLACQSSWIARGLIRQINPLQTTSGRFGLAGRFAALLDTQECQGLSTLPAADREQIRDLAMREEEGRRGQSEAGKPAEEVPASPPPPPAIAPETP
jgi:hypothetical protein